MARYHGKQGAVYIAPTATQQAAPLVGAGSWDLDYAMDEVETTGFNDDTRTFMYGKPKVSGSLSVIWDSSSDVLFDAMTASSQGGSVRMYLYPSTLVPTTFWSGMAALDMSTNVTVDGAVKTTAKFISAGSWSLNFIPTDIPESEYDALVYLYNQTAGASWTTNTNWLKSALAGDWYGVTVSGGHVTGIDLRSNNLVGTVNPITLYSALPSLTTIALTGNSSLAMWSDVDQSEGDTLVMLYRATAGGGWTNKTGWLLSGTVAGWYGVTVSGGHVTQIIMNNNNLVGTVTLASLMTGLPSLTQLRLHSNASLIVTGTCSDLHAVMVTLYLYSTNSVITGSLSDMPPGIQNIHLGLTDSVITGSLSDIPAALEDLTLYSTDSVITGSLSDIPAALKYLVLHSTNSIITGPAGGPAPNDITLQLIRLDSTGMNAAACDDILQYIWEQRAVWTYATPAVNVGGTNTNPNGTYQAANPPTTGLEYAYELENDSQAEGFIIWDVTY